MTGHRRAGHPPSRERPPSRGLRTLGGGAGSGQVGFRQCRRAARGLRGWRAGGRGPGAGRGRGWGGDAAHAGPQASLLPAHTCYWPELDSPRSPRGSRSQLLRSPNLLRDPHGERSWPAFRCDTLAVPRGAAPRPRQLCGGSWAAPRGAEYRCACSGPPALMRLPGCATLAGCGSRKLGQGYPRSPDKHVDRGCAPAFRLREPVSRAWPKAAANP